MNADELLALNNIEKSGYHVVHVPGDFIRVEFSYSIGIERTIGRPEVVVTGLDRATASKIIDIYYSRARSGEVFLPDKGTAGFRNGVDVIFKAVDRINYPEWFGWCLWLYADDQFRMLQLIYPSTDGKWPWDSELPSGYSWDLPPLY